MPPGPTVLDNLKRADVLIGIILGTQALAVVLTLAPPTGDRWLLLGLWSLLLQWVTLGTTGALYLARHPLGRLKPAAIAAVGLAILAMGGYGAGAIADTYGIVPAGESGTLDLRLAGIVLAVGAIGMVGLINHLRARQFATQVKQAELDALHARVRPHFLFNTLNTAASLVRLRPVAAEAALLDLADLFRAAMAPRSNVPLAEEVALCRQYLAIEQIRFADRLRVDWHTAEPLPNVVIPLLSIQPLLENAVHHGVEVSAGRSVIAIRISEDPKEVRIVVSNPIHRGATRHPRHGIGLIATRSRLQAAAGDSSLITEETDNEFRATLSIPKT